MNDRRLKAAELGRLLRVVGRPELHSLKAGNRWSSGCNRLLLRTLGLGQAEPVSAVVFEYGLGAVETVLGRELEFNSLRRELLVSLEAVGRLKHAGAEHSS